MENEKILSNEELLDITAGDNFISISPSDIPSDALLALKYGIRIPEEKDDPRIVRALYSFNPIISKF